MAQKFGRQAQHLKLSDVPAQVEESKGEEAFIGKRIEQEEEEVADSQKNLHPRVDPSTKLK